MDNIYCLREATSNDKEAVLEILANDNAYDGLDYLPDYYDYFQNSKHVTSYVYTDLGKIAIHVFEYHRSNVSSKLKSLTAGYKSKAKVLENLPAYLLSPPYSNYLFPEGRVVVDWVPFRSKQTNNPLFKGKSTVFFSNITHAVETKSQREINEAATQQQNSIGDNIQCLLSACTLIKTYHCFDLSCIIDIFGNDFRSLRDHSFAHLQRIEDTGLENVNVLVVTTKGACKTSLLDEILKPFEIKSITSGLRKELYIEQVVYEKEIE